MHAKRACGLRHGDNAAMALKLFRTTGYSTLLQPGEARLAPHPARLVIWGSLWLALACNVGLWRLLAGTATDWRSTVASVALIAGASGMVLSLLGWRRTLKPALTLASIAGALLAVGLWSQQLPIDALWHEPPRLLIPGWASFMRWQPLTAMLVLAVLPIVFIWNTPVRRLSGPAQLRVNLAGACVAALVFAGGVLLLA
jgi:lipid A ethanolaminephosphotransferase